MSLKESSATALVRFTGLGIICFNKARGRGEIAVIRDHKHTLSVSIQKPALQEGSGNDAIFYQDIATYRDLPKDGVRIEIGARGGAAVEGFEIYRPGDFDRLGDADANDFRWIVNMNTLHGDALLRPTGQHRHPLTKIYIAGGLFYTHRLDAKLFFEKLERDADGHVLRREVFGSVGETLGVKLEADEVNFQLSAGARTETHTLKRVEGLPFRIEIKNMDYNENPVYSDMADYYGYLASPGGNQFDLAPIVEDDEQPARGGSVNQKEFCHPVASDLSSIDEL
jgi:hypothetical protein